MRIIFLDLDGVIVLPVPGRKSLLPSRHCIEQLNRITDATGAQIVLSTGRRFDPDIELTLAEWGVRGSVVGRTPVTGDGLGGLRSKEITQWLAEHADRVESFVILDDEPIDGDLHEHFVQTVWAVGLTEVLAIAAIKLLESVSLAPTPQH